MIVDFSVHEREVLFSFAEAANGGEAGDGGVEEGEDGGAGGGF